VAEGLRIERRAPTLLVTIDRGDGNLFTKEMIESLIAAVQQASGDGTIHFIRLRADGPSFCMGRERVANTIAEAREEAARIVQLNEAVRATPLTVLAEVHGDAAGFGAGLVAATDIAIAAEEARFSFPEIRGGLPPTIVISWLYHTCTYKAAFDLVTSGKEIHAESAATLGLITEVVTAQELASRVDERIEQLANSDANALRDIKRFFSIARTMNPPAAAYASIDPLALATSRMSGEGGQRGWTRR
jgi:methylglutaconyl-CoA hydratase